MGIEEQQASGGTTDSTGGVGNGQATGTGQVSESFDVGSAVDSIGSDLGFATEKKAPAHESGAKTETTPAAAAPAAGAPTTPEEQAAADTAAATAAAGKPAGGIETAPKTWTPAEAAVWASIPDAAKAAIARREEDMFKGLEQYKVAANFGSSMNQVLSPYNDLIRANNINPHELIGNLLNAQYQLSMGTQQQKLQMFQQLAKDYRIDLAGLGGGEVDQTFVDPEVAELRAQIQRLESGQTAIAQERQRETLAKAQTEVEAFASNPANVHFNDVADEMIRLFKMDKNMPLAKAYETAVWSNPVTRAKEIARQDAEKQAKAASEATKKAADVKAATATNVQVGPKVGAATLPLGSMDDTMEATMREIKNRT